MEFPSTNISVRLSLDTIKKLDNVVDKVNQQARIKITKRMILEALINEADTRSADEILLAIFNQIQE